MRFVELFAGIGGFSLGLERAGHTCVGQVEIDPYAQRILAKHWPDTPRIADVNDFHGHEFGPFDMLVAGYPCQPFSNGGKREGESDPRHLWPHVHRIIRDVRPRFVLLENVPGHRSLGFGAVLGDLAESGYDAEWDCIPASAVGAPHRRDRLFTLAYPSGEPVSYLHKVGSPEGAREGQEESLDSSRSRNARGWWATEPGVDRMVDGAPNRLDRMRGLGNAVVPQVAEWIGKRLPRE